MSNILTDRLPEAIKIGDIIYPINSNFRECLKIIIAFEDNELTWLEKQIILLDNLYEIFPSEEHLEEAINKAIKFLDGGKKFSSEEFEGSNKLDKIYSFTKDAEYILSAFRQTHGMDLTVIEYLHWWHFLALFMDLGSETMFCNLVGLRKRIKTGKASKEEKELAREIEDILFVPEIDMRTLKEKEIDREFSDKVKRARQKKKEIITNG